ncbi:hypothetical protein CEXT_443801 [Caerostris extrusa]|uniref:Uncharacterized protein n=1 Tax=Caerostris extrusa TaxID=172846 RepID=A0AAV4N6B8_CAEEX|nr:hypothetical protein CEXT_443801 [Caerostris extrusa]
MRIPSSSHSKRKIACSENDACSNRQGTFDSRAASRVVANASVLKPGNYGHFEYRGMKEGCEIWAKEKRTREERAPSRRIHGNTSRGRPERAVGEREKDGGIDGRADEDTRTAILKAACHSYLPADNRFKWLPPRRVP